MQAGTKDSVLRCMWTHLGQGLSSYMQIPRGCCPAPHVAALACLYCHHASRHVLDLHALDAEGARVAGFPENCSAARGQSHTCWHGDQQGRAGREAALACYDRQNSRHTVDTDSCL